MTDIEMAKNRLEGHSICLCKNGETIVDDSKGISPMMKLLAQGQDLNGWSAADIIVGKAAAVLFVKAGIKQVYARVLSHSGKELLERFNIPCEYGTLTEIIINRRGTDICPMEKTVADIDDIEQGYLALQARLEQMKNNR
jgi:hypothetical protein